MELAVPAWLCPAIVWILNVFYSFFYTFSWSYSLPFFLFGFFPISLLQRGSTRATPVEMAHCALQQQKTPSPVFLPACLPPTVQSVSRRLDFNTEQWYVSACRPTQQKYHNGAPWPPPCGTVTQAPLSPFFMSHFLISSPSLPSVTSPNTHTDVMSLGRSCTLGQAAMFGMWFLISPLNDVRTPTLHSENLQVLYAAISGWIKAWLQRLGNGKCLQRMSVAGDPSFWPAEGQRSENKWRKALLILGMAHKHYLFLFNYLF